MICERIGRRDRFSSWILALVLVAGAVAKLPAQTGAGVEPAKSAPSPIDKIQLTLTSPLDYQVLQRQTKSSGSVVVEGMWDTRLKTLQPDRLEARLLSSDNLISTNASWMVLPFSPEAKGFRGVLPVSAGGWYRLELRLRQGDDTLAETAVAHVGVGEVFFILGQSNSANHGEIRQKPTSGKVTAFDGSRWAIADDPQPGASGTKGSFIPSFGDAMVRQLDVPVGVVCLGVGSTSVREWLPKDTPMTHPPTTGRHTLVVDGRKFVSSGELFERFTSRLRQFPASGFRAVLWHQGESDSAQASPFQLPVDEFRNDLSALITKSRTEATWDVPWFVAQVSYHSPTIPGDEAFRAAQRSVADGHLTWVGPNTDELGQAWRERDGQGVHFNAAGLKRHGELWADVVGKWIEEDER